MSDQAPLQDSTRPYMKEPKTFQRISTVIEAIQWTGDNKQALADFGCTTSHYDGALRLFVAANQAWLPLEVGEWIAHDDHGYYPIKDGGGCPCNYYEVHHCSECGCTWEIDGPSPCPQCDDLAATRAVIESGLKAGPVTGPVTSFFGEVNDGC